MPCIFMISCNRGLIKNVSYGSRPHFEIKTKTATYFFDKAGGGLSRLIDADGTDWVHFNGDAHPAYPAGAAGGYRGIPNMVYDLEDGGAGHPGFNQCISKKAGKRTIRTISKSGKWQWAWTFFDDHASLTIEKTDTARAYWFLYEGPVAGSFNPSQKYWGTDLKGPGYETPSLNRAEDITGNWQWAYFGDKLTNRILYVVQHQKDTLRDFFAYLGNTSEGNNAPDGMVVFGFSRDKGSKPLETKMGVKYSIGFLNRKITSAEDHKWVSKQINEILNTR
jgi:hypothetical protein